MIAPILQELADENVGKFAVGKLDVDNNRETAMKYGIRSIPTLLVFKDGEVAEQIVGVMPKDAFAAKNPRSTIGRIETYDVGLDVERFIWGTKGRPNS